MYRIRCWNRLDSERQTSYNERQTRQTESNFDYQSNRECDRTVSRLLGGSCLLLSRYSIPSLMLVG